MACYVSSNLVAKRREDLEILGMECLWLEIRSNNNKFLLVNRNLFLSVDVSYILDSNWQPALT